MEEFQSVKKNGKDLVSVRAYKGDATTLLAFDLDESLVDGFVGFTISVKQGNRKPYYLNNRLCFKPDILAKNGIDAKEKYSSLYSPYQKFRWVHVPSSEHYVDNPYFGDYSYAVTPRYLDGDLLRDLDPRLTVTLTIEVSPFHTGDMQVGFTRAFISSQAYTDHFGNNGKMRPNEEDLIFDIKQVSGKAKRWNPASKAYEEAPYTFEEQHEYLGWQARDRVMEFLNEVLNDNGLRLDVFAFDLDEPLIIQKLISLAKQGRLRIILDDSKDHVKDGCFELKFQTLFGQESSRQDAIFRGHFRSLRTARYLSNAKGRMP